MTKGLKRNSASINDPQRCAICATTLTLYPKDFLPCPHCHKSICRQCWGETWEKKTFAGDACAHLSQNDGLTVSNIEQNQKSLDWDWYKLALAAGLVILAGAIVLFLLNLFAF